MAKNIKSSAGIFNVEFGFVSAAERASFAKNLAVMLKSGLILTDSLETVYSTTKGKMRGVVEGLYKAVSAGESFSAALERYPKIFSGYFVGAIYAGENSGTLSQNLERVAKELAKEAELMSKVRGALIYPSLILGATISLGIFMAFYILPKIIPMFQGMRMKLPWTTVLLINTSNFLKAYGWQTLLGSALLAFGCLALWRWPKTKPFTDRLIMNLPLFKNISRHLNTARFCRVLATMLSSGLNITESLLISEKTLNNWYYRQALAQVRLAVDKGGRLSTILARQKKLFPEMVVRMVAVGEQSGHLEDPLYYLAEYYEEKVDEASKNLATVVEPLMLLIIGSAVCFLALAIVTPIYNMTGNIR
ncbi:hypothetical protein COT94_03535 [Candidatus Falkowbacteria bacterium CG10_big_fil_rev_8_21_14_0_10_37_14]|uniref:Type II secretion system protein GspF domain-containing protein n=1 Tax=Candidatus Falkowbacteria bacterium CG10_big_fil_rev_8_21_14_0_10_37_14 TaxID=1974561 RepID=A0A2M6WSY2_9BACT|nr:type II secretion system F family protein [Candidatus Falkowbacteria bacterium]PIT95892.1 MAG: hypothetical protein COT94_03535 [Candidatus Falkowbacteria bacterium CG10_big_fil_rev_8_21_14_0_10_37_14]